MKKDPVSLIRPAVRSVAAYHLDRRDVPVKLDQNENDFGVPPDVRAEIAAALGEVPLHRYPSPGQPEIRDALSKANDWPADGILVGNGSDDLLHTLAVAFLEPGRKAVMPTPSFYAYAYNTRLMAAETIEVPLGADLQYEPERLLDAIEEHEPAVVYLCSPNNPTGSVLQPEAIRAIVERSPGIVALDEAYWEFASWNGRSLLERHKHLILFRTFSKAMAMAAARIGYLLAAPELAQEMKKAQPPYPLNRFSQAAAEVALTRVTILRERAALVVRERERLYARLLEKAGVSVFPSEGNFLLFRTGLGSRRTFEGLVAGGVLVRDVGSNPLLRDMLRVAVGTPDENETFLRALERTLEEKR